MKHIFLQIICLYKKAISPILHYLFPNCDCRFFPSCSEYGYKAVEKYGIIRGMWKTLKRVIHCNPFNKGGYDPLA